jgi:hypothetical protein
MKPHLNEEQFADFASKFHDNAMVIIYVHKNPVASRGTARWYAFDGKPADIDDIPKPAALKLLRQLNSLERQLIERLGRPLLKK